MKPNQRWVSRDIDGNQRIAVIWVSKPNLVDGVFCGSDNCVTVCEQFFRTVTGITIKPGEFVLVEFSAKVVKQKVVKKSKGKACLR